VNGVQERVKFLVGAPGGQEGWWRCADVLAEPAPLRQWAARLRSWLLAEFGEAPERTVTGYLLGWYLNVPATTGALFFHTRRRVPMLRPGDLAFRLAAPRPLAESVALLTPEFACLPDDPAAGRAGVTVVADEAALGALLRARFAGHAAKFVPAFAATMGRRLGRRTLWAAATDALDQALWVAGRDLGDEARGVADAALVLPAPIAPLTAGSTLRPARTPAECTPDTRWTRRRESCCFHYVLIAGDGECRTCPRVQPRMAETRRPSSPVAPMT
jgi:hypothetical protein